jgi:hypothetical protein
VGGRAGVFVNRAGDFHRRLALTLGLLTTKGEFVRYQYFGCARNTAYTALHYLFRHSGKYQYEIDKSLVMSSRASRMGSTHLCGPFLGIDKASGHCRTVADYSESFEDGTVCGSTYWREVS